MCRTHRLVAFERYLFDSTQCPSCLKEFHTCSKVLGHLRHSTHCKEVLLSRRIHCVPAPGAGSNIDRNLHERVDGAIPCLQAEGPCLPDLAPRPRDVHDIPFLEALYMFLLDLSPETDLLPALREFILQYPISWTKCSLTLQYLHDNLNAEDAEIFSCSLEGVRLSLQHCMQSDAWSFLTDCRYAPHTSTAATLTEWEAWCTSFVVQPPAHWSQFQPLPQALTRYKILLHAFAGRRRRGDIEWFLAQTATQHDGFILMPVSIDIVIDKVYGDISKSETREFWLHYMRMGYIAGFIAGPPCNTWSRARARQLSEQDTLGPRVVRTFDFPWGLESLRLGEVRQVLLGTLLLSFAFESIATMALHGGSGLVEHPREPDDPNAVSIWRLSCTPDDFAFA